MFKFIKHFKNALRYTSQSANQRRLTFYSEGKNYWPHLGGIIQYILDNSDIPISYISSDENDPGLNLKHPNLNIFEIDEGSVRNWLFENIKTDLFVMTMPDINQYQVKRSKYSVHYLYIQHSLLSLHMVYRKGAFDHYDTIFCAGPHHVREMKAIIKARKLKPKVLVEHGYARLDSIVTEATKAPPLARKVNNPRHVLIAPSWGPNGVIETGVGAKITDMLLEKGYKVTLRPHPETIKHAKNAIDVITKKHAENPLFNYESNVAGQDSLHASDLMISAWSGVALDYGFGLGKPVVFIDVPKKINNPEYKEIPFEPVEVYIRDKLGLVISPDNLEALTVDNLKPPSQQNIEEHVFNLGKSDKVGGDYIIDFIRSNSQINSEF